MCAKHSKNSNTRTHLSHHERAQLKYGTVQQRLGADSQKPFDACWLCLQPAINPVVTPNGYMYCKECILNNIVTQKKEIKRQQQAWIEQQKEEERERQQQQAQLEAAKIEEFAKVEGSVLPSENSVFKARSEDEKSVGAGASTSSTTDASPATTKRAEGQPEKTTQVSECFWIPSHTPEAKPTRMKEAPSTTPVDPICGKPLKLKHLVDVKFQNAPDVSDGDPATKGRYQCPCCVKTLTNANKAVVMRPCGHAICLGCFTKFTEKDGACYTCGKKLHLAASKGGKSKDVIHLATAGTGFSGNGNDKTLVSQVYTPAINF